LILTDFGLPDMDGIRVVRSLRKLNTRLRHVPIIMLTALEGDEYYYAALRAGCTAFLTKPTDFETLQLIIEKLLDENFDHTEATANHVQFCESYIAKAKGHDNESHVVGINSIADRE